jgi:hypothetical protein
MPSTWLTNGPASRRRSSPYARTYAYEPYQLRPARSSCKMVL